MSCPKPKNLHQRKPEDNRSMFEDISDGYFECDLQGNITFCNSVLSNLLGRSREELSGSSLLSYLDRADAEIVMGGFRAFLEGTLAAPVITYEMTRKDGARVPVETSLSLIRDPEGRAEGFRGIVRDITERVRREEAQKNELKRYIDEVNDLYQNAPCGCHSLDENGVFLRVNDTELGWLGYSREEVVGKKWTDFLTEEGVKAYHETFPVLKERGWIKDLEFDLVRKDGTTMPVLLSATTIRDENGRFIATRSTLCDLAKRKQDEAEIRKPQRKLAELIGYIPSATLAIDRDGRVIGWNRAMESLTGVKAEEMLGKGDYEYALPFYGERRPVLVDLALHPELAHDHHYTSFQRVGAVVFGEAYAPGLPQENAHISATAAVLRDSRGEVIAAVAFIRDNTEHRKIEEALAAEQERLALILDGIPIPAFMIDRDGIVTLWNRNNEIFTGKYKDEVLGEKLDLSFLLEEKTQPILAELVIGLTDGEIAQKYGPDRVRKSNLFPDAFECESQVLVRGERRLMLTQASRIKDSHGEVIGVIQTGQDITALVKAQEEGKKLQAQLIQAQKMEAVGTLAGGIAHDFNNLLMGIQGYTSLMMMELDISHPHYEKLKAIEEQVAAGANLTRQLLGFARRGKYEVKTIDLNDNLYKSSTLFGRTKKEIVIHRKFQGDLWPVEADPGQIEQVFMNLLVNAWQAMPGGGHIYIETSNVTIWEGDEWPPYIKAGKYVKVSVSDTGVGMDEWTRERIFDPFFTTKEMGRGTGLGLAMVYGIVKGHNGYIDVSSEPGRGSTFTVYLPASDKQMVCEDGEDKTLLRGTETILLVDDEAVITEVMRDMLELLGYRVFTAAGGREALRIYEENKDIIDLVILDMIMPDMGGGETFDHLREANPGVRVILSSGYSLDGAPADIMSRGCQGFIQKPVTIADLSQKIRDVLAGS